MNMAKRIGFVIVGFYMFWAGLQAAGMAAQACPGWEWYEWILGVSFVALAQVTGVIFVAMAARPTKRKRQAVPVASKRQTIRKVTSYPQEANPASKIRKVTTIR